ncbi:hypothetical protein HUU39_08670 [candidate division KSB1 bacterium]|nr:hypothetical protein [bacterium]NUM65342.1 hypothetical protein [candidate division KSB1 bacterium]
MSHGQYTQNRAPIQKSKVAGFGFEGTAQPPQSGLEILGELKGAGQAFDTNPVLPEFATVERAKLPPGDAADAVQVTHELKLKRFQPTTPITQININGHLLSVRKLKRFFHRDLLLKR